MEKNTVGSFDRITQINAEHYLEDAAIDGYSNYALMFEEKYFFPKYFSKGSSVLDLACGAGRTTVRMHEMGYKVKGIDLSKTLINTAKKRFPYIEFEEGNYCDIKESDNSFDNILVSYNGLDYAHPENMREKALSEFERVIKKGGHLMFSTHNIRYLHGALFPWNQHKLFMLKHSFTAFQERKYIFEPFTGLWTYYASPEYITEQTEKYGFKLKEIVGNRPFGKVSRIINKSILNKYVSPWLNYIFEKTV